MFFLILPYGLGCVQESISRGANHLPGGRTGLNAPDFPTKMFGKATDRRSELFLLKIDKRHPDLFGFFCP